MIPYLIRIKFDSRDNKTHNHQKNDSRTFMQNYIIHVYIIKRSSRRYYFRACFSLDAPRGQVIRIRETQILFLSGAHGVRDIGEA